MQKIIDFLISPSFLLSLVVVACAVTIWVVLKRTLGRRMLHNADDPKAHGKKETYLRVSASIVKYLVTILTVVLVLQINGVNVSSLITGLGIFSAVAGLALQDVLKDIIMGMNILEDDFFVVGDVVKYGQVEGKVIAFTVKTTKIQDIRTNNIMTISNRNISEIEKLSNWLDVCVPAAYEEDVQRVRAALLSVCTRVKELPEVEDCQLLGTDEFGESSISYRLRVFCPPSLKSPIRRAVLGAVQDVFTQNGITIPFPQLDVHNK